jgi:hypothetical protein
MSLWTPDMWCMWTRPRNGDSSCDTGSHEVILGPCYPGWAIQPHPGLQLTVPQASGTSVVPGTSVISVITLLSFRGFVPFHHPVVVNRIDNATQGSS